MEASYGTCKYMMYFRALRKPTLCTFQKERAIVGRAKALFQDSLKSSDGKESYDKICSNQVTAKNLIIRYAQIK
ncbi:MAG: hypothetical protein J5631_01410 [Spirochaetaceae bacterium]|nr:hypothetical protein [Spirochaetaceae bacterium]